MPTPRQRAMAASSETRALLPAIPARSGTDPTSYFWRFTTRLPPLPAEYHQRLRSAVIEGDPLDVAKDWQNYSFQPNNSQTPANPFPFPPPSSYTHTYSNRALSGQRAPPVHFQSMGEGGMSNRILVLNTANEKKPGGEWEGGVLSQEEGFARRSNLIQALTTTDPRSGLQTYYPLENTSGIYSPNVVVFREGFDKDYEMWRDEEWTTLAIVSAPAVRRPKVDESGLHYSFTEERQLQREKMKSVLRIAALNGHTNLVLGGFGSCGPEGSGGGLYKNPVRDVCLLWKDLLFEDEEFKGWFKNVVFAFGKGGGSWMKEDGNSIEEFKQFFG
ncbi:unnamed protein product [Tuber aestivum]|uniref:Microbial-type PARG catalytic domain-containing protein n=1 Tax=Tuber aestivum TaxID=59557 RepID=A0A292PWT8_9PEZI|nr:unnamed protein product [Tuber aestivum]